MATEIKTLASGQLRRSNDAFLRGERVLYAAPHPSESFNTGAKRAAMVTAIRFFNNSYIFNISVDLYFVRYDSSIAPPDRRQIRVLPIQTSLVARELRVETTPLVLEEGDLIVGNAALPNWIDYVISGIERDV